MPYETEWKPTKPEDPDFKCRECGSDDIEYRRWESSDGGHSDVLHKCNGCKRRWWTSEKPTRCHLCGAVLQDEKG